MVHDLTLSKLYYCVLETSLYHLNDLSHILLKYHDSDSREARTNHIERVVSCADQSQGLEHTSSGHVSHSVSSTTASLKLLIYFNRAEEKFKTNKVDTRFMSPLSVLLLYRSARLKHVI